ncbi:ribbon-helix-helix protein, CopG family [Halorussus caseinilyticus]|uniref:Ribbon-helix-helix protein, CopG family n=1 Tax=Halorussus caseinilyticus TaxID=3034025 RepID=A0ABD5WJY3_9EURY|nr:ribbon-helix-helix protein, CopG family [Halorussus sp. DT72]
MTETITERVQEISEVRGLSKSEIFEQAFERGVEILWIDVVLSQYLDGEIDRDTAIELVGRDQIKRAEREVEAVEDDVQWGLDA